jgi:hypothetical protein
MTNPAATGSRQVGPPPDVETVRQPGRPTVTTAAAGKILGLTSGQVRRRVVGGSLPGGAEPRPKRPRYYVYCDVPPLLQTGRVSGGDVANLSARIIALETANLLLLAGEARLREAANAAARATDLLRQAERERSEEARLMRLADAAKADALSALLVPGDAGRLGD